MNVISGKHVLAIDDTPSIRTFLRISLEVQGMTFNEASTAEEGLRLCQELEPDVVVLDLGLPDRDGLDVLYDIKATMSKSTCPSIIVLTVRKERQMREKACALGADAYMTKPFLMDELIEIIEEQVAH